MRPISIPISALAHDRYRNPPAATLAHFRQAQARLKPAMTVQLQ